jgi:hypothetical protein
MHGKREKSSKSGQGEEKVSMQLLFNFHISAIIQSIGGAHQQTSERAAPPVSVEEKRKTIGEKRKLLLFLLMRIQN